jgi:hypothetical protein
VYVRLRRAVWGRWGFRSICFHVLSSLLVEGRKGGKKKDRREMREERGVYMIRQTRERKKKK